MRSLTGTVNTEISKTITRPVYLVELGFSTPVRISSRGSVLAFSNIFAGHSFSLSGITPTSASITIRNDDLSLGGAVLGDIDSVPCKIWIYYGDTTTPNSADIVSLFDGYIDEIRAVTVNFVTIGFTAQAEHYAKVPRYRVNHTDFNHLPSHGRSLVWGGERATIEVNYG